MKKLTLFFTAIIMIAVYGCSNDAEKQITAQKIGDPEIVVNTRGDVYDQTNVTTRWTVLCHSQPFSSNVGTMVVQNELGQYLEVLWSNNPMDLPVHEDFNNYSAPYGGGTRYYVSYWISAGFYAQHGCH